MFVLLIALYGMLIELFGLMNAAFMSSSLALLWPKKPKMLVSHVSQYVKYY